MAEYDDVPYIVIERERGSGLGTFLVGAIVGAGVALLFAPRSGAETQALLKERAEKLRDAAGDRLREAQNAVESRVDSAREGLHAGMDSVRGAVERGRRAASEARGELEEKLERSKAAYRAGIEAAREAARAPDAPTEEEDAADEAE